MLRGMAQREQDSVQVVNARRSFAGDAYHQLLRAPWWGTLLAIVAMFLGANILFALLYLWTGGIANAQPGSFLDAFFFSVQTLGTIGYGSMVPVTRLANTVVTVESLAAIVITALSTGLVFSKFSMPTARLAFSREATISTMDGQRTFAFRLANERGNYVVEAQIRVALVRRDRTAEGLSFYRMYDLLLARDRSPALGRSWTVLHRIDAQSPLSGATTESLQAADAEIVVTVLGIDGTSAQTIHGRHTYSAELIRFGRRNADMLIELPGGKLQLDYAKFHDTVEAKLS